MFRVSFVLAVVVLVGSFTATTPAFCDAGFDLSSPTSSPRITDVNLWENNSRSPSTVAIAEDDQPSVRRATTLLQDVRSASFPELAHVDIQVRPFQSDSDYFRTRFSLSRYASLRKMRFYIEVNPRVFERGAPEAGVRAIIAHELEHVLYLSRRNRIGLLLLGRLASADYRMRFERGADLGAIARGYGDGLSQYRAWLYRNVPAGALKEKRRDYYSPDEIAAIESVLKKQPAVLPYWRQHIPKNLAEIQNGVRASNRLLKKEDKRTIHEPTQNKH